MPAPHANRARPLRCGPEGRIARLSTPTGLPVGDIHSYLLIPESPSEAPVLVDTGVRSPAAREALESGLAALGFRVEDLGLILLTHAHPDHFGQAAGLARRAGCEVWAHEAAQESIDRYALPIPPERREVIATFLRRLGVPESRARLPFGPPGGTSLVEPLVATPCLRGGDEIEVAGLRLQVIHTPGHCPELVVFWHAESGTLLSGDHILPDITPVCLFDIPKEVDAPRRHALSLFLESLAAVEPLPVRQVLPSHGDPLPSHRATLRAYRLHADQRMLRLARMLERRREATAWQLAGELFPRAIETQLHLVLSEVLGHLDLLEEGGHVALERRGEELWYLFRSLPEPRV